MGDGLEHESSIDLVVGERLEEFLREIADHWHIRKAVPDSGFDVSKPGGKKEAGTERRSTDMVDVLPAFHLEVFSLRGEEAAFRNIHSLGLDTIDPIGADDPLHFGIERRRGMLHPFYTLIPVRDDCRRNDVPHGVSISHVDRACIMSLPLLLFKPPL